MTETVAPARELELEGIKNVRDLPGDWLVDEWKTFEESEGRKLAQGLYPKLVKILHGDEAELSALIHPQGFWRDLVALSWTFRTFHEKA